MPRLPQRPLVLVVDDEKEIRDLVRRALEPKGFAVDEADNGVDGIRKAEQERPSLVLLDLRLPSLDGWAALARIRELPDPPPVVVVTAVGEINITPRVFREGAVAFLGKPFRIDELVSTCQATLAARSDLSDRSAADERRQAPLRRSLAVHAVVLDAQGAARHRGRIVNLGVWGAQLDLDVVLAPGDSVRLSLSGPDEPAEQSVSFGCIVKWWRRINADSPGIVSHGLAFTGLSAEDQKRIRELAGL